MSNREWRLLGADEAVNRLAADAGIPLYVAQIMARRGVSSQEQADLFLSKRLAGLGHPRELDGAMDAARIILAAIKAGTKICVHGDYDTDGAAATAIILQAINACGGQADYYIPSRDDGYGLKESRLVELASAGYGLLVAVDCGITAVEAIAKSSMAGLPVIVIDHHTPSAKLPNTLATVHPWFGRGFKNLCAAGTAFKVAWAMGLVESGSDKVTPAYRQRLVSMLAPAGLATVADMVPLVGENRILVTHGFRVVSEQPPTGLAALLSVMNADKPLPTGYDQLGFYLVPALNAAGRMGYARLAVEILLVTDEHRARDLAIFLHEQNKIRRKIEQAMLAEANEMAVTGGHLHMPAIVIANSTWHNGQLGPVASRLAEKHRRPVVLLSSPQGRPASGSARTAAGVNILDALGQCADLLTTFGGHACAAGLTIDRDKIGEFRDRFCAAVESQAAPEPDTLVVDAVVKAKEINSDMAAWITRLGPFGHGNPRPILAVCGVQVDSPRLVGGNHFSFLAKDNTGTARAIYFGHGQIAQEFYGRMRLVDVAFEPKENTWGGRTRCDLHVVAIRDYMPEKTKSDVDTSVAD